jgi:hypothetical protein
MAPGNPNRQSQLEEDDPNEANHREQSRSANMIRSAERVHLRAPCLPLAHDEAIPSLAVR